VRGNPKARQEWAAEQVTLAAKASRNLGLSAHVTFSGALAWPFLYPWPPRPAHLIDTAFEELARRWKPILDAHEDEGVDVPATKEETLAQPALPDKPSIAVLRRRRSPATARNAVIPPGEANGSVRSRSTLGKSLYLTSRGHRQRTSGGGSRLTCAAVIRRPAPDVALAACRRHSEMPCWPSPSRANRW
jgi:hypothetical protein